MSEIHAITAKHQTVGNEVILEGNEGNGKIAAPLDDVTVEDGKVHVAVGTSFRLIEPVRDEIPDAAAEKEKLSQTHNVYSTTCIPFGNYSYLYECTPTGLKYIGPCGMPGNCAYPCTKP